MPRTKSKILRWERRPAERPGELLEAALRVFATRGYRSATLEEVAAAAGVTKGAVYHYFDNKEQLLSSALEHHQQRAFARLEGALDSEHGSATTRIRLLFRSAFGGDDPIRRDVLLLLHAIAHEAPNVYRHWVANGPLRWWRVVESLIVEGQRSGEFRRDADAEVTARIALVGVLAQFAWQRYADSVPGLAIDRERLVDSAVDMLVASLQPPEKRA
ncbi:MAG TPA: TetR/AcrR family transcriptional regulator [Gemmatimonadaceae bacterium]|jgi:AcrR family transcriptional regulator|nr:TetR/AcrR family transcriptional regulator [Gemmatimonadaceae bacterium]